VITVDDLKFTTRPAENGEDSRFVVRQCKLQVTVEMFVPLDYLKRDEHGALQYADNALVCRMNEVIYGDHHKR
jgi:hypothetical protein